MCTPHHPRSLGAALATIVGIALLAAVACDRAASSETVVPPAASAPFEATAPATSAEAARVQAALDRDFPLHGLVTGLQLIIRDKPDPAGTLLGWLRVGARVRLKSEPVKTATCATGWYALHPQGFACAGEGIQLGPTPPESSLAVPAPAKDAALPYPYFFVKDDAVPEYHRLPSRDEQREAVAFSERLLALRAEDEARAQKLLTGQLRNEPPFPTVVRAFLSRGFFVAAAGVEVRAFRRFVRTVRGRFIKDAQLESRSGSSFQGVTLGGGVDLPIAWAVRAARPIERRERADGTVRIVENREAPVIERLSTVPWVGRERIGDALVHKLADGRYVRAWFLSVAERVDPPPGIRDEEPWVHVDRGEQTLVLYRGRTPIYATLVSTGLEGHDTPLGLFSIRAKHVAATMSDIGADAADERYSIEDVPWTQYFDGSIALHGAFWHERFGLRRSHGCVNLAPLDAHHIFNETWPLVPEGWHGVSAERTGLRASKVLITE